MSPQNFAYRNEKLAILIQTLKSIGQNRITEADKLIVKSIIADEAIQNSMDEDLKNAPVWIRRLIYNLK